MHHCIAAPVARPNCSPTASTKPSDLEIIFKGEEKTISVLNTERTFKYQYAIPKLMSA
jgi:hypothetical protein